MSFQHLKSRLAALISAGVFAVIVVLARSGNTEQAKPDAKPGQHEWLMFGGSPSRNMVNTSAKGVPIEWDEGKKKNILWTADLGSKAYGGPIISGSRIFVGTNNQKPRDPKWVKDGKPIDLGIIMAFGRDKGDFLWQTVFTKLPGGRVVDWPEEGICSTPVVEGDKLYFVSNRCEVVCADVATGKHHWKLDMIGKLGVFPHNIAACSPLLVDDNLWIVTANGVDEGHINVPAPRAPSFIKVNKKNGDVLWQYNGPTIKVTEAAKEADEEAFFKRLVNRGELIQHGQWSNPAYGVVDGQHQVIFPGGEGWIYSFDPDGKLLWKFDCNPKDAEYELAGRGTRNDFIATPVIYDGKVYIGVGQDPEHEKGVGHLWCIDMRKRGDVSPELVVNNAVWPPETKPNPNSAKVWHFGGFTTPEDRKKLRRNYYFGRTMSTCAIKDDLVYAAELQGFIHCLDAKTGKVYWTHYTGSIIWSSPSWIDGKVYLGTDSGKVFVFAHGKEEKLLTVNDMDSSVRATPVAANGVLYVMTENKLYAIAERKQ
ncbi:MAG: PQQ-binding-like beta-propeller repeat protein [Gemmataceae bacterium]|nr:PQQ-binding-like beta-propeller repeat protein [Gemmataceae bacterium]